MTDIEIKNCVYKVHPIYDLYASDSDGNVIDIIKKVPTKGVRNHRGYMQCMVRKYGGKQKEYFVHRFVWECFNGVIPEGKVIDHINNNKEDDRLCNLQLVTQQENCKKSAKDRDYTFVAKNHENKKCVKATNCSTNEVSYFNSMYVVQQHIDINAGIVKMVCEGINKCKSGVSKKDGHSYRFEYFEPDDLPSGYKKSANIRPKIISDENRKKHNAERVKKWGNKEWRCSNCGKTFKNNYKYAHSQKCNR